MNIRAKTTATVRKRSVSAKEVIWGKFDILFFVIILGLGIFAAVSLRLTFNSKGVAMSRESESIRSEIHSLKREIENLSTRREALMSWPNIRLRISQFNLPLRLPNPVQVYRMAVNYDNNGLGRIGSFSHQTADNTVTDTSFRSHMGNADQ